MKSAASQLIFLLIVAQCLPLLANNPNSKFHSHSLDVRPAVLTLWLPLVVTSSGERARPEASRHGCGPAAETEGEAALLRGGLPARRGRLPVLGAPLYPRLQET